MLEMKRQSGASGLHIIHVEQKDSDHDLSKVLLSSIDQDKWMEALTPLRWILIPIGINIDFTASYIFESDNSTKNCCGRLCESSHANININTSLTNRKRKINKCFHAIK